VTDKDSVSGDLNAAEDTSAALQDDGAAAPRGAEETPPGGAGGNNMEESISDVMDAMPGMAAQGGSTGERGFEAAFDVNQAREKSAAQTIDLLMDVNVMVRVELGRTKKTIGEILSLTPGMLVELDQSASENVDLFINDKLLATGEVTVVDGHFAVKVTRLLSKAERLRSMI
jgi:flagellar motor switch protein FliN